MVSKQDGNPVAKWNLCSRPDLVTSLVWSSSTKVSGPLAVHQEHGGREPWAEPSWYLFLLANTCLWLLALWR